VQQVAVIYTTAQNPDGGDITPPSQPRRSTPRSANGGKYLIYAAATLEAVVDLFEDPRALTESYNPLVRGGG